MNHLWTGVVVDYNVHTFQTKYCKLYMNLWPPLIRIMTWTWTNRLWNVGQYTQKKIICTEWKIIPKYPSHNIISHISQLSGEQIDTVRQTCVFSYFFALVFLITIINETHSPQFLVSFLGLVTLQKPLEKCLLKDNFSSKQ